MRIPQELYSHQCKKSQTRYSKPPDATSVSFCCYDTREEGIVLQNILDKFRGSTEGLWGAKEPVLPKHATNVTLHILVGSVAFVLDFAIYCCRFFAIR